MYGLTTPSDGYLNADVLGSPSNDVAINLHIDGMDDTFWVAPDLVEFVSSGSELTFTTSDGVTLGVDALRRAGAVRTSALRRWFERFRRRP